MRHDDIIGNPGDLSPAEEAAAAEKRAATMPPGFDPRAPQPAGLDWPSAEPTVHGWVTPLPSGLRARCGGPGLCAVCQAEQAAFDALEALGVTIEEPSSYPAVIDRTSDGEVITAEVLVDGRPFNLHAAPPECQHLAFTQQVVVANLVGEVNGVTQHVAWRVQIKVRCAECGVPFRFKHRDDIERMIDFDVSEMMPDVPDALTSHDRLTLGAIIEPTPEHERGDEWPAIGGSSRAGDWPTP